MKKLFSLFIACMLVMFNTYVSAQEKVLLSSGKKGGTNWTMIEQLRSVCGKDFIENGVQDGGSPATLEAILGNQAEGGLVQTDVLWLSEQSRDLSTVKLLFPMHREQVHVVALDQDVKTGGVFGFGGKTTVLNDTRDLKGLKVASQGGSIYTAKALDGLGRIGMVIDNYSTVDEVLNAVKTGKAHAAILVGGAPMEDIKKLPPGFRLLPIDPITMDAATKKVYDVKTVNYQNLAVPSVKTLEVEALLVVNNYEGAEMVKTLTNLRSCFEQNFSKLREQRGSHAAWRTVVLKPAATKWPLYGTK